jgi:hypothetical protein
MDCSEEGAMRPRKLSQVVRTAVLSAAVFVMLSGADAGYHSVVMAAQHSGSGGQPVTPPATGSPPSMLPSLDAPVTTVPDGGMHARMEAERVKAANDDRHKRLSADVDKLLELTNELKTDVDKTNKDELSLDVIKKAQEIEKLAHDVQSRMKN